MIGAEPARGEDDDGCLERILFLAVACHKARDFTVFHDEALYIHVRAGADAPLSAKVVHVGHEIAADGAAVFGPMDAGNRCSARCRYLREVHAAFRQPFDGGVRIFAHVANELLVTELFASDERVLGEQLVAVLNAFFFLESGLACVHSALGEVRVASYDRHLFEQHDVRAGLLRAEGCRHAGAACSHDDDVELPFVLGGRLGRPVLRGASCQPDARQHGCKAEAERSCQKRAAAYCRMRVLGCVGLSVHNDPPCFERLLKAFALPIR